MSDAAKGGPYVWIENKVYWLRTADEAAAARRKLAEHQLTSADVWLTPNRVGDSGALNTFAKLMIPTADQMDALDRLVRLSEIVAAGVAKQSPHLPIGVGDAVREVDDMLARAVQQTRIAFGLAYGDKE